MMSRGTVCRELFFGAAVVFGLSSCSPYVYESEIASFSDGVNKTVQAFDALKPEYTSWATQRRDKQLIGTFKTNGTKPSTSDGCEALRRKYDKAFADKGASAHDFLSQDDYAACSVTPEPRTDPKRGLPTLEALGSALQDYAAGLTAIANAEDESALQKSFGKANESAKKLLEAANEELVKKNEPALDAVGALAYQAGLTYLRQRRFNMLKDVVNNNAMVVNRSADLLAEAAFDIYGPILSTRKKKLEAAENAAVTVTEADYVKVWTAIEKARDEYIAALKASPVYSFVRIKTVHKALRESLNNPTNREQLSALYESVNDLKKAAESPLEAVGDPAQS